MKTRRRVIVYGAISADGYIARRMAPRHRSIALKLLSTRKFPDGVVHLNYRVLHPKA